MMKIMMIADDDDDDDQLQMRRHYQTGDELCKLLQQENTRTSVASLNVHQNFIFLGKL